MKTLFLVLLVAIIGTSQVLGQTSTPTPMPFPTDDMYQALATSEAIRQQQSTQSLQSPNGANLLPASDGREIFGYAKWLLSSTGAAEIAGPFALILIHSGILVALQMALIAVYVVIVILVYTVRWVIFIFKLIVEIFRTLASIAGAI